MRVDGRLVFIGVFFLVFGGVLLAARQGWIPADVMAGLWQLWPVLLIAIGVAIILGRGSAGWIGAGVAAACLGVLAAGLVETGIAPFVGCGGEEAGTSFEAQRGELASTASVDVTFSCGDLDVAAGSGSEWSLAGSSRTGRAPTIRASDSGVSIESAQRGFTFGGGSGREDWRVTLPSQPTIDLGVTLNAGSGRLVLQGARLSDVGSTVNAGSLSVDLRGVEAVRDLDGTVNAGSNVTWLPELPVQGSLTVNAGSLVICAPDGLGLRLNTGDNPISSNDFDRAGLVRTDDGWETPGFATAPIRTELDVSANAGSLSLNPSQPCSR